MNINKIQHVNVDWMDRWANRPCFEIRMDVSDHGMKYLDKEFDGGTAFLGIDEDYASFFFHTPNNETGYGGRVFELPLIDGSTRVVIGPWSSRASCMTEAFNVLIVDAVLIDEDGFRVAGAVTGKALIDWCHKNGIEVGLVEETSGEVTLEPLDEQGNPKPSMNIKRWWRV